MIEKIPIVDRHQWLALRQLDAVTASDVAAVLNANPWRSARNVYDVKTGAVTEEENENMVLGTVMEPAIANSVRKQRPNWRITQADYYVRDSVAKLGATPDFDIVDENGREGVLETKFTQAHMFATEWVEGPPIYYLLQCLTQLMLTGREWGVIAVMVGGSRLHPVPMWDVPRNPKAEELIWRGVADFRGVLERRTPPPKRERASPSPELVESLAPKNDGSVIDFTEDNRMPHLLMRRAELQTELKPREKEFKEIEGEIKEKLGSAAVGKLPGWLITRKTVHQPETIRKAYDYDRMYIKQLGDN